MIGKVAMRRATLRDVKGLVTTPLLNDGKVK